MPLSAHNVKAFLLEASQDIEEYADATVHNIFSAKTDGIFYPPNSGLTKAEQEAIRQLPDNEPLRSALRKLLADNTAGVLFNLLNLLDGTAEPKNMTRQWTGLTLCDTYDSPRNNEEFKDTLHDSFFETYWDWIAMRPHKNWRLDQYED